MIGMALVLPLLGLAESGLANAGLANAELANAMTLVVTKVDGTQLSGKMIAWNATEITLQIEGQEVTITAPQLLRAKWRQATPSELVNRAFMEFVDGTRLPHLTYEVQENIATVTTPLAGQPIKISTDKIEFVQLSTDLIERETIEHDLAGDQLMIRKKKKGAIDSLTGVLGDISSEQVQFTWEGESIPVKRTKVVALTYFHARNSKGKDPICWLNLYDGSRLPVIALSVEKQSVAKQTVHVRTTSDLELSFPLDLLLEADYSQGKLVYLSDLKPIRQRWTPRIGLPESAALIRQHGLPRRDQSYTGSATVARFEDGCDRRRIENVRQGFGPTQSNENSLSHPQRNEAIRRDCRNRS